MEIAIGIPGQGYVENPQKNIFRGISELSLGLKDCRGALDICTFRKLDRCEKKKMKRKRV